MQNMDDNDTQASERQTTRANQVRPEYSDSLRQARRPKRQKSDPPEEPESGTREAPDNP